MLNVIGTSVLDKTGFIFLYFFKLETTALRTYTHFLSFLLGFLYFLCQPVSLKSQTYLTQGKVLDAQNGEPIPFANIYYKANPQIGTTSDLDGNFALESSIALDTLVASFLGYQKAFQVLDTRSKQQAITFRLQPDGIQLQDIVVKAGGYEEPVIQIMKEVIAHKKEHDKRQLQSYQHDSYIKIELFLDNIPENIEDRKLLRQIKSTLDSIGELKGDKGQDLIPIVISEVASKHHYQSQPERIKEELLKHKINGIGFRRGRFTAKLSGGQFQEYNFYKNWMTILTKDFISPISDNWKLYYDYQLVDTVQVGKHMSYRIDMQPKHPQDLAFKGSIWIDTASYALTKVDASIDKGANINFIEGIQLYQELERLDSGAWLPKRVEVTVDVTEFLKSSLGLVAKFYVINRDFKINQPYRPGFFDEDFTLDADAYNHQETYWEKIRPDTVSQEEKKTYVMIDSLRKIKGVKVWTEAISTGLSGYQKIGKVELGHILNLYTYNNVEGHRLQLGARTNIDFSDQIEFSGYLAYGTLDERFKYQAQFRYIPSRDNWTVIGVRRREEIDRIGVNSDDFLISDLVSSLLRWGNLDDQAPFFSKETTFFGQTDLVKGVTLSGRLRNYEFSSEGGDFAFFEIPGDEDSPLTTGYTSTDLTFSLRLAKQETFLYQGNQRISTGTKKLPTLTLRYSLGIKNFLNGDFDYHRIEAKLEQNLRLGVLGRTHYQLSGGYTPSTLPASLLFVPVGNSGFVYNFNGFNVLNYIEFVNDRYAMLNVEHNFEGLIVNRIPLLRALKLRTVFLANMVTGGLRSSNQNLTPPTDETGNPLIQARSLGGVGSKPFVEIGYGFSNIFKFLQVTAVHRLTYRDNPDARKFGVFVTGRLSL